MLGWIAQLLSVVVERISAQGRELGVGVPDEDRHQLMEGRTSQRVHFCGVQSGARDLAQIGLDSPLQSPHGFPARTVQRVFKCLDVAPTKCGNRSIQSRDGFAIPV
jgi:hypothetical protein